MKRCFWCLFGLNFLFFFGIAVGQETPPEEPIEQLYEKAYDLYNQAKYDEAIALFEQVLLKDPGNVRAHAYYGVCFMGKEQFDRAIEELEKALKLDEKFPLTTYALAVSYARKSPPDTAKAQEYLVLAKKYGYQVPVWFEQYLERLKSSKITPQEEEKQN